MNLTFRLLLFLITLNHVRAQNNPVAVLNQKITIEAKNETIRSFLKRIEKQANKRFSYDSKLIDSKKKLSGSFKEKTVPEIISVLFENKVSCKVAGNYIVLYKKGPVAHYYSKPEPTIKKVMPADSRAFLKSSKTQNDTMVRYFIDIIVPDSAGKDSIIRTESIEVPSTHVLKIKNDTTLILLKKDTLAPQ